jgi:hypothetical protein
MAVEIRPVESHAELMQFVRLPAQIYKHEQSYVPPLTFEREGVLSPKKGAFFKHGTAQYWLALRDGQAVGRISAQIDDAQPEGVFDDAGLFGCFDAIDDSEVTQALLDVAEDWLVQQGRTRAAGPFLLSINQEPGLLVEGQDEPPLLMVAWHPKYLQAHLTRAGYNGCKDLHYWRLSDLATALPELERNRQQMRLPKGVSLRSLNMKKLARDVEIIRNVYNDSWQENWGFVPMRPEDTDAIAAEMKPLVRPDFGVIAESEDAPAAVAMVLPNLFELSKGLGPDLSPLGWVKFGWRAMTHTFRTGTIILLGVSSQYRHSIGGGVIAMKMVDELLTRFINYEDQTGWVEAGWVLDSNVPLQKILLRFGFKRVRTLRIFDKKLEVKSKKD